MSNNIDVKQKAMSGGAFAPPLMLSAALETFACFLYEKCAEGCGRGRSLRREIILKFAMAKGGEGTIPQRGAIAGQ